MKTFFKYVGAVTLFSVFLVLCFFLLVDFEEEERIENRIAGLTACLMTKTCKLPVSVDNVQGIEFVGVYLKSPETINIKYMVGNGAVVLVLIKDNDNQVTLTDIGFDGMIDMVGIIDKGQFIKFDESDFERDYSKWQNLYNSSLRIAWNKVVPIEIKNKLRQTPPDVTTTNKLLNNKAPRIKA